MATRKKSSKVRGRTAPIGRKLGPPYGVVSQQVLGGVTIVVRKIFARSDYFHWRIIATSNPSLLELVERERGGVLKQGDENTLEEAKAEALEWLRNHPKAQLGIKSTPR